MVTSLDLLDFAEVTGRPATAALLEMATAIITGKTADTITAEPPPFIRALFPDLDNNVLDRIAVLVSWGLYVQHTATVRELARKWRLARVVGNSEDDTLDLALAAAAELAEQRFAAWALDMPTGAAANSANRFMSALAERIAQRVVALTPTGERRCESNEVKSQEKHTDTRR
jgi:hypothetical protein